MSNYDLCKSMNFFPIKETRKKIKFKSNLSLNKKVHSYNPKDEIINCKTASNRLFIETKRKNNILKIPQLQLYNNMNNNKKMTFFSIDKEKKLFIPRNKRIIQLNGTFNNKTNYYHKMLKDIQNKNIFYEKELPKKKIVFIPKIFDSKNEYMKNIRRPGFNHKQTNSIAKREYNDSPSQLIQGFRNNNRLIKNNSLKNKKIKFDFSSVKSPEPKSKIINDQINNIINKKINENSEVKESNISEKSIQSNHKSPKILFTSEKPKTNNYQKLIKNDFKKQHHFKIKKIDYKNKEISAKKINNMYKKHDNEAIKLLFIKKINKKESIKKIIESKDKKNKSELLNDEESKSSKSKKNKNLSSDINEIILSPKIIEDINIIKRKENNIEYEECQGISNEIENKKIEKYEIGNIIGKGSYAFVKIAKNIKTNEKYALKIYEKSDMAFKKDIIKSEIETLKLIDHKNIVKYIEDINTESQIIIVQELVEGFSLKDYYNKEIKRKKSISSDIYNTLKKIFKQIFEAMNYLHQKNISHRDIKLENILINNNYEVKIIDFGFGLYNPEHKIQYFFCGTPKYIAPEVIDRKGYYGEKADLWSLGVLIYKIYCDDYPFKGKSQKELFFRIKNCKYKLLENIPNCIKDIITNLIIIDPMLRINCEKVLNSPLLKE